MVVVAVGEGVRHNVVVKVVIHRNKVKTKTLDPRGIRLIGKIGALKKWRALTVVRKTIVRGSADPTLQKTRCV